MTQILVDKIRETREKLQNHAIAKKILALMNELRSEANSLTERRWIWELIQNAKDVSYENGISIQITYLKGECKLIFSHNGRPFSIENIVGLIEQIGTKERNIIIGENRKPVGKFGTGFITTHLLSENVNVRSYLEEPIGEFIKFELELDRSGDINKVGESVDKSINVLETICGESSSTNFDSNQYNTFFTYYIGDKKESIAKCGIDDLIKSIPYTLTFVNKLKEISLPHENLKFTLKEIAPLEDGIKIIQICKECISDNDVKNIYLLLCSEESVDIAIPIEIKNNQYYINEIKNDIPRIFCEFPLIGTENFGLPFIINSSSFNPTKDRNGIALTDRDDPIVNENKNLFLKAVNLYIKILNHISISENWCNMFFLANINVPNESNLISKTWYDNNILKPLKEKVLHSKIVNTNNLGRSSIIMDDKSFIDFPTHKDENVLEDFCEICSFSDKFIIPQLEEIKYWSKITWLAPYKLSTHKIGVWILEQKNIKTLSKELSKTEDEVYNWLNKLLQFFIENDDRTLINSWAILPNQNGILTKMEKLQIESEFIAEELKDIALELGFDFRNNLLNNKINNKFLNKKCISSDLPTNENKYYTIISEDRTIQPSIIANFIENSLKQRFSKIPRSESTKIIAKNLLQWFNKNPKIAENIFNFLYKDRHLLREDNDIIEDILKAEILDKLIKKSGCEQSEIEEIIKNNETIIIKVSNELYPENEDEIEQSQALTDNSDEKSRISISQEAKEIIIETLKRKGFIVPLDISLHYTIISGILKPDGTNIKIVVKSGKAGKIYFNPNEWLALTDENTQLFVVSHGNIVRNVTLNDLKKYNDTFHMRFNTTSFAVDTNLKAFADFFHYLPYTHFIFDTPESTTDYLEEFGLNKRNPSIQNLTPDDKNLLR